MKGKKCFVISPIGEEGSDARRRADKMLRHVIMPVLIELHFEEPIRADKISEAGIITNQILQHLIDDDLVIADLSMANPNVFYELAIRHAVRKPVVQLISKGEKIPFDVGGMRTVVVDLQDLDNVEQSKFEINRQIQNLQNLSPEDIESPISVSLHFQNLKESSRPEEKALANLISVISQLRNDIATLTAGNPQPLIFSTANLRFVRSTVDAIDVFVNVITRDVKIVEEKLFNLKKLPKTDTQNEALKFALIKLNDIKSALNDVTGFCRNIEEKIKSKLD